jgi:hypothetical protein
VGTVDPTKIDADEASLLVLGVKTRLEDVAYIPHPHQRTTQQNGKKHGIKRGLFYSIRGWLNEVEV